MTARSRLKPAWCSPAMLCLSLSVAAHVVVLTGLQSSGQRPTTSPERAQATKMQVRMVSASRKAPLADTTSTPLPEATAPLAEDNPTPASEVAQADDAPAPPNQEQPPAQDEQVSPLPPQPYAEYIPRPQLSIAPIPRAPILIAPPEGDKDIARRVIVLSLYIDEHGRVRHIEADEDGQPSAYVQAARAAFMNATFSPGQLEGQQVKSRTRVEVVFDNTPLDGAH